MVWAQLAKGIFIADVLINPERLCWLTGKSEAVPQFSFCINV